MATGIIVRNRRWIWLAAALFLAVFGGAVLARASDAPGKPEPRFRPAPKEKAIQGIWRVEFVDDAEITTLKEMADELIGPQGRVIHSFDRRQTRRAAWVECDEAQALAISQDARVRSVISYTGSFTYSRPRPAILLMSIHLGTQAPSYLDDILNDLINDQVPVVVATGQTVRTDIVTDHRRYWPMRVPRVMRVGMTNNYDEKVDSTGFFSSYPFGIDCLDGLHLYQFTGSDLFAPAGPGTT